MYFIAIKHCVHEECFINCALNSLKVKARTLREIKHSGGVRPRYSMNTLCLRGTTPMHNLYNALRFRILLTDCDQCRNQLCNIELICGTRDRILGYYSTAKAVVKVNRGECA